eukprot:scaffold108494_cov20-Tisochrysis_lutea.AAC.2
MGRSVPKVHFFLCGCAGTVGCLVIAEVAAAMLFPSFVCLCSASCASPMPLLICIHVCVHVRMLVSVTAAQRCTVLARLWKGLKHRRQDIG